ncbi:MAG: polyphosphate kinase 1 [Planctomycetaceae bacterium]|nr:polyphosphate kinase 1 [Planctomycetaceae bacterium]
MAKIDLNSPDLYFNRELSWLEFNDRVLREGLNPELPLLERLNFLAIVSSNLDEFFMIRVAGLMQQRSAKVRKRDRSGMTPNQQLKAISERAHRMVAEQSQGIREVFDALAAHGLFVHERDDWDESQREFLSGCFAREIDPLLTPMAIEELSPQPLLPGLQLNVVLQLLVETEEGRQKRVALVPVPGNCPRFIQLPADEGTHLARLEDVIADNAEKLFPGCEVTAKTVIRLTRDADVAIEDDDASDLLNVVEQTVIARGRRRVVRLAVSAGVDAELLKWLRDWLGLTPDEVYEVNGMLDAKALWQLVGLPEFESLADADWPPQPPRDLIGSENIWQTVQERDVMLFHPYESFDPVVKLVEEAAADPDVLAIKQTLYRTSGNSPIVKALSRASAAGKQVTVLVELKARFDEAANVVWARQLEDAGCHVIYGIAGLKTHAKALLIVRRESGRIHRYVHLATGNYNDRTARVYSDVGLITRDRELTADVAAFFNLLTGYSEAVGWSKLTVEPRRLKERFIELIDREINVSTKEQPGLIMAKVNSLEHPEICQALYRASQAGVRVLLNVRGICCLRPGVKGVSENIEVRSIVDRFLEHARIFFFRNGGHEEVYMSSADWMRRNLDNRLEIIFPVLDPNVRRRLVGILETYFADNVKARCLLADGTYEPLPRSRKPVRAQEKFYREAVEAARAAEQTTVRFRPLKSPETDE